MKGIFINGMNLCGSAPGDVMDYVLFLEELYYYSTKNSSYFLINFSEFMRIALN